VPLIDLSFVPDKWRELVTGSRRRDGVPKTVDRRYFELCLFSLIMQELRSGDLCMPGSEAHGDYREQLVPWTEYHQQIGAFGEQAGVPTDGPAFVARLKAELESAARQADDGFPNNEHLTIETGVPMLKRLRAKPDDEGLEGVHRLLRERLTPVGILDALADTEYWLQWTRHFAPLSGHGTKLERPRERYVTTAFCYGCNLGPTQTARSIRGLDRRQVAFVNQRHVTEETLDAAIATVINATPEPTCRSVGGSDARRRPTAPNGRSTRRTWSRNIMSATAAMAASAIIWSPTATSPCSRASSPAAPGRATPSSTS
jgi:hypothetical protein